MGEVNRQALAIVKHVHVIIMRNWLQLLCCTYLLVVIVIHLSIFHHLSVYRLELGQ